MWVSRYFVLFIFYSCLGWLWETVFCTVQTGKWDNRGFLYGPLCPIYGFGAVAITGVTEWMTMTAGGFVWWQVFLISVFGSMVLEYGTSWGLEKLFHAYWWDYSGMPLNIHGRICLPYSLCFGGAGLLIVYGTAPLIRRWLSGVSPAGYEGLSLLLMAVLATDTTLTVSALTSFENTVADMGSRLDAHMELFVETIVERSTGPDGKRIPLRQMLMDGKSAAGALLREERERFSQKSLEDTFRSMSRTSRAALRRVRGFRKTEHVDAGRMEDVLQQLRDWRRKD